MNTKIRELSTIQKKKDKWLTQEQRVFSSLQKSPKTRLQLSHYEGVPIQNVCRFIGKLRKLGKVCIIKIDIDKLSGMRAEYLSCDPHVCFPCAQLNMFN